MARRHARLPGPPARQVVKSCCCPTGSGGNGLWQVGLRWATGRQSATRCTKGDAGAVTRTLHVPAPFQASFCDAILEHQALLAAAP